MNKSILKVLTCLLPSLAFTAQAQYTVPNGNFENWSGNTPTPWVKTFETEALEPFTKTTDKNSGSFALQLLNSASQGRGAEVSIPKTGTTLPLKLKGFVKYNLAPGQRARITVEFTKSETSGTSTTFINEPAGWISFSGTANTYVPFEINLDYRLVKQLPFLANRGIDFDKLSIVIESYGPISKNEDMFNDIDSPEILNNTFITVDDLSFEGTTPNENISPLKSSSLPENFEEWTTMDGKNLPINLLISGYNASQNKNGRMLSRSTDAKNGTYALGVNLAGTDTDFTTLAAFPYIAGQKKINFSAKGTMASNDSIVIALIDLEEDSDEPSAIAVVTGNQLTSAYQTFSLDISKLKTGTVYLMFISFTKTSTGTYSVLVDDLNIDGVSSVGDLTYLESIHALPNPCQGAFILSNAATENVRVFNSFGDAVAVQTREKGTDLEVDLSGQAKGIYFVHINNFKTIKVINQ